MTPLRLAAGIVALVTLIAAVPACADAVDPRFLVGEWAGHWQYQPKGIPHQGSATKGQYYLLITKVQGGKVYGVVSVPNWTRPEF